MRVLNASCKMYIHLNTNDENLSLYPYDVWMLNDRV